MVAAASLPGWQARCGKHPEVRADSAGSNSVLLAASHCCSLSSATAVAAEPQMKLEKLAVATAGLGAETTRFPTILVFEQASTGLLAAVVAHP